MIEDSVRHLVAQGREVIYDAEHFFDGYLDNPEYALRTLEAAARGGAANLSLCETNGGKLVPEVARITAAVVARFGAEKIGVHCHNDSGVGVAVTPGGPRGGSLAGPGHDQRLRRAGGQRQPGHASCPICSSRWGAPPIARRTWRSCATSRCFSTSWRTCGPIPKAPFVGQSAFAHKGGLHANAAQKVARSYEHIDPALVGNRTRVLVSDMAGRSSLALKARELGPRARREAPRNEGADRGTEGAGVPRLRVRGGQRLLQAPGRQVARPAPGVFRGRGIPGHHRAARRRTLGRGHGQDPGRGRAGAHGRRVQRPDRRPRPGAAPGAGEDLPAAPRA